MSKLHKWKKSKESMQNVVDNKENSFTVNSHNFDFTNFIHTATSCKYCIKCGLIRGNVIVSMGYFPRKIYFRDSLLVSVDKIPYECTERAVQLKQLSEEWEMDRTTGFLSTDDFNLD